jgi:hypothetical protein
LNACRKTWLTWLTLIKGRSRQEGGHENAMVQEGRALRVAGTLS